MLDNRKILKVLTENLQKLKRQKSCKNFLES